MGDGESDSDGDSNDDEDEDEDDEDGDEDEDEDEDDEEGNCIDSEEKVSVTINGTLKKKKCSFFSSGKGVQHCEEEDVKEACPVSCNSCDDEGQEDSDDDEEGEEDEDEECVDSEERVSVTINATVRKKKCSFFASGKGIPH